MALDGRRSSTARSGCNRGPGEFVGLPVKFVAMPTNPGGGVGGDLGDLLHRAVPHESASAPLDASLRIGAAAGTALLALYASYVYICWSRLGEGKVPDFFIVGKPVFAQTYALGGHAVLGFRATLSALVLAIGLALYSRGFAIAPPWAHVAAMGVLLVGCIAALPLLLALAIAAVNVAIVVLITVVVVGFFILLLQSALET